MNWTEIAAASVTVIGFVGTVFNVYLTSRMRADMAELKVWAMQNFQTKEDSRAMIQTYLSQERSLRPVASQSTG